MNYRSRSRVPLVLAGLVGILIASDALGIVGSGSAETMPSGTPLPGAKLRATKLSGTEVSTGGGIKGPPFAWGTGFSTAPKAADAGPGGVCAYVTIDGPLFRTPQGALAGGPGGESGGTECGSVGPKAGLIDLAFTRAGSIEQPFLKTTEEWPAFEVGTVAYPVSVDKVRLRFAGGASTVLPLRGIPLAVRPKTWEPFRYVSFGVYGCVNEVEGLSRGRAVTRKNQAGCGD